MTSVPRETIADRYELLEMIGQGGQALVFAANDLREQRRVAVKVMSRAVSRDPRWVERMAREQQAMVSLAGTNAVGFIDLCTSQTGALCLVMELLSGSDLEEHQKGCETRGVPMNLDEVIGLLGPIVDTLEKAHAVGIVHRDLKPGNIFLEEAHSGRVPRLLDFGFARMTQSKQVTETGTILGSPSYIAPEMWLTLPDAVDPRADVYSLGVILYRLLTLELPFPGDSLQAKFVAATSAERPSLHQRRPDLPINVDLWVERALAIEPGDRFPTVRALWAELLWALDRGPHPHESKRKKPADARELKRIREWLQAPLGSLPNPLGAAWRVATGMFSRLRRKTPREPAPAERKTPPPQPSVTEKTLPSIAAPLRTTPSDGADERDRETLPDSPRASERVRSAVAAGDESATLLRVVSVEPKDVEADVPAPPEESAGAADDSSLDVEMANFGTGAESALEWNAAGDSANQVQAPTLESEHQHAAATVERSVEIATLPRRAGKKIATRKRRSSQQPRALLGASAPLIPQDSPSPVGTASEKSKKAVKGAGKKDAVADSTPRAKKSAKKKTAAVAKKRATAPKKAADEAVAANKNANVPKDAASEAVAAKKSANLAKKAKGGSKKKPAQSSKVRRKPMTGASARSAKKRTGARTKRK